MCYEGVDRSPSAELGLVVLRQARGPQTSAMSHAMSATKLCRALQLYYSLFADPRLASVRSISAR